jgi:hypothetical protein
MIYFSSVGWPWICLLDVVLVLRGLLVLLPRTMVGIMPNFPIAIAYIGVVGCTILHRSIVGIPLRMEPSYQSAVGGAGHHSVASAKDVVGLGCDSTDWMAPGTSC